MQCHEGHSLPSDQWQRPVLQPCQERGASAECVGKCRVCGEARLAVGEPEGSSGMLKLRLLTKEGLASLLIAWASLLANDLQSRHLPICMSKKTLPCPSGCHNQSGADPLQNTVSYPAFTLPWCCSPLLDTRPWPWDSVTQCASSELSG